MPVALIPFCAILLTALALVPAGAHLFELPNKIGNLPQRPIAVARVLASQFKKLGLEPANSINSVL